MTQLVVHSPTKAGRHRVINFGEYRSHRWTIFFAHPFYALREPMHPGRTSCARSEGPLLFVELSVVGVPVPCLLTRHSSRKYYRVLFRSSASASIFCPGHEAKHYAFTNSKVSVVFFRVRARFSPSCLGTITQRCSTAPQSPAWPMKGPPHFSVLPLELSDELDPATEKTEKACCRHALRRMPYNKPLFVNYSFSF